MTSNLGALLKACEEVATEMGYPVKEPAYYSAWRDCVVLQFDGHWIGFDAALPICSDVEAIRELVRAEIQRTFVKHGRGLAR